MKKTKEQRIKEARKKADQALHDLIYWKSEKWQKS